MSLNTFYQKYEEKINLIDKKYFEDGSFNPNSVNYFNVHRPKRLIFELQNRLQHFDPSIIPNLVQDSLGKDVDDYIVSNSLGTGHIIVFVTSGSDNFVVRTNMLLEYPETYMELEHDFLKIYKDIGIPVNDLLYSNVKRDKYPFDFQVLSVLPGLNLGSEWSGSKEDYENICKEQGKYIAKMYSYKANGWGRITKEVEGLVGVKKTHNEHLVAFLDHDLDVIEAFEIITSKEREDISNLFSSVSTLELFKDSTSHLLHNDPSDLNMRYLGNKFLAYFDWENAVMFDPINEIATAPSWKSIYPKQEKMLEGFVEELGFKPGNLEEKMDIYFLRKMLDKVAFALKGERLGERHVQLFKEGLKRCKLQGGFNGLDIALNIIAKQ